MLWRRLILCGRRMIGVHIVAGFIVNGWNAWWSIWRRERMWYSRTRRMRRMWHLYFCFCEESGKNVQKFVVIDFLNEGKKNGCVDKCLMWTLDIMPSLALRCFSRKCCKFCYGIDKCFHLQFQFPHYNSDRAVSDRTAFSGNTEHSFTLNQARIHEIVKWIQFRAYLCMNLTNRTKCTTTITTKKLFSLKFEFIDVSTKMQWMHRARAHATCTFFC